MAALIETSCEMGVPPDADPLAQQGERHRIKGAGHFDVSIGVDRAFAAGEERKRLAGKRVERPLLDLDKVRPDLAPRGAVDAQPRDCAIPVPQKRILRAEAVEAAAFERVLGEENTCCPVSLTRQRHLDFASKVPSFSDHETR